MTEPATDPAPARAPVPAHPEAPARSWRRIEPWDAASAAFVLVLSLCSGALLSVMGIYSAVGGNRIELLVPYSFALSVPLLWRRRFPGSVLVAVSIVYFAGVTARIPEIYGGNIAIFIAFYTVGAWAVDRRRSHIVRIGVIVAMLVWLLATMFVQATGGETGGLEASALVASNLLNVLINIAFFGGAYYFGERTYGGRVAMAQLQERTAELERERERTAAQAVALDRVRIARELHDVVAHHVSLMGVQAGAARAVLDSDPESARAALRGIEDASRATLVEMRQLLGALRGPEASADLATTHSSPDGPPSTVGIAGLPALVERTREAGLPVAHEVIGEVRPVSDITDVSVYRIAQEALTNARRHGGPGVHADVRLRYRPDDIEIEIATRGRAVGAFREGLGLRGIRERAGVCGGGALIVARNGGGMLVRATLPTGPAS